MTMQECQRTRTLSTEVFKAVNGRTPSNIQELFEVKETLYNLRSPPPKKTIMPKANSTIYGHKSLKHEGNTIWNRLPVDIKKSESVSILKRKISKWQPRY